MGVAVAQWKRRLKRAAIAGGLEACALAAGIPGLSARGRAIVFTLHHVRPAIRQSFAPNAHLEVTPDFLDAAIKAVTTEGYRPAALADLPALLAAPDDGSRYVAFTLDDGYRDNRDHALSVFARHGVPFTVFITRGFAERTTTIWWETAERLVRKADRLSFDFGTGSEVIDTRSRGAKYAVFQRLAEAIRTERQDDIIDRLDALARDNGIDARAIVEEEVMNFAELQAFARQPGVALGAHTLTHPSLAHVDMTRLGEELSGSADYVATVTGARPATLAYPYGDRHSIGTREHRAALDAGFSVAVLTEPGMLTAEKTGKTPTALPRVSLNGHFQKPRYVRALASGLPFRGR